MACDEEQGQGQLNEGREERTSNPAAVLPELIST